MKVGAQIWSNPITGTAPSNSNPFTSGDVVGAFLTVSGIGFKSGSGSSGINNAPGNDRFNTDGYTVNATSAQPNDYINFVLTPTPPARLNFNSFTFSTQNSASGPNNFVVRSSIDGFSTDLGNTGNIDLSGVLFQHITSQIEFRIYPFGATNPNGTFSVDNFSFSGQSLPIHLSKFDVILQNRKPLITWTTYSESNNDHFVIQRSQDGRTYFDLAIYKGIGQGASDHELSYSHVDLSPASGINYYRLKQVDLDGSSSIFPSRSVLIPTSEVRAYPTLFSDHLMVDLPLKSASWEWKVFDLTGHELESGKLSSIGKLQIISFNRLADGMYLLKIKSDMEDKTVKIIKRSF